MSRTSTPRVVVAYPRHRVGSASRVVMRRLGRFGSSSRLASEMSKRSVERHRVQADALEESRAGDCHQTGAGFESTDAEFSHFLFEPGDIVVAVGQDGLVPNLAKYLAGTTGHRCESRPATLRRNHW